MDSRGESNSDATGDQGAEVAIRRFGIWVQPIDDKKEPMHGHFLTTPSNVNEMSTIKLDGKLLCISHGT